MLTKKKMEWKVVVFTIMIVLIFTSFIYNLRALGYLGIHVEQTYIKVYVCSTIFHFFLANWLLKRYKLSIYLFILCIIPHLIIDTQVYFENVLVPLRSPFATIFPILGTIIAFIYNKLKSIWAIIAILFSIIFLIFSWLVWIPKMEFISFVNGLPPNNGLLNKEHYKTISGDSIAIEDTSQKKVLLIEWYFVGCPPCEEKYVALKQLADTFKNKQLDIIMICDGLSTEYNKFKIHAQKNAYEGITFLYDSDSISNRFCKGGIQGYPMEFLTKRRDVPKSSFLGFEKDILNIYLNDEIKKIRKLANE